MDHKEEWLHMCFELTTNEKANRKWRLLICDGYDSHSSRKFVHHCLDKKIMLLLLPLHLLHLLQSLDVGVFHPLKSVMTIELNHLFCMGLH